MAGLTTTPYPKPLNLERTYKRARTKLDGVRRFLASEGIVPFADDKYGVSRIGGDVWLRPSATRRVGNYLDLTPTALAGFRIGPDPLNRVQQLGLDNRSIYERFVEIAEATQGVDVDSTSHLKLRGYDRRDDGWTWRGSLIYDHTVTIDGGERIYTQPEIRILMREDADGSVHVAVILRHPGEFDLARKWLNYCNPNQYGWLLSPVRVKEDAPERHQDIGEILERLGDGFLTARNPKMSARERIVGTDQAEANFRAVIEDAPYRTKPVDWNLIVQRLDEDEVSLAAITAYVWAKRQRDAGRSADAIVAIELRQRPSQDDQVQLVWSTGKSLPDRSRPNLTMELWDDLPLLDWDEEVKVSYLLRLWDDLVEVQAPPAAVSASVSSV